MEKRSPQAMSKSEIASRQILIISTTRQPQRFVKASLYAPAESKGRWSCTYEIAFPKGKFSGKSGVRTRFTR
jgi:hypothetical protein